MTAKELYCIKFEDDVVDKSLWTWKVANQASLAGQSLTVKEKVLRLNTNWKGKVQKKQHKEKAPFYKRDDKRTRRSQKAINQILKHKKKQFYQVKNAILNHCMLSKKFRKTDSKTSHVSFCVQSQISYKLLEKKIQNKMISLQITKAYQKSRNTEVIKKPRLLKG